MPKLSQIVIWFVAVFSGNAAGTYLISRSRDEPSWYVSFGLGVIANLILASITWFILSRLWTIYSNRRMEREARRIDE